MQFTQIALALAAFPALLMASPTKNTKPIVARADAPPGGYFGNQWGKCNGNSCDISELAIPNNKKCDEGSCGGPDGGDGKYCGYSQDYPDTMYCPGGF